MSLNEHMLCFKFNIKSAFGLVNQKYPGVAQSELCGAWCRSSNFSIDLEIKAVAFKVLMETIPVCSSHSDFFFFSKCFCILFCCDASRIRGGIL